MKTTELFSMAVLCKDLGIVLVHFVTIMQNECINNIDAGYLSTWLNANWESYSLIRNVEFYVIRDESQVEGYEIVMHLKNNPHVLMSVNFNLS